MEEDKTGAARILQIIVTVVLTVLLSTTIGILGWLAREDRNRIREDVSVSLRIGNQNSYDIIALKTKIDEMNSTQDLILRNQGEILKAIRELKSARR